MKTSRQLLIPAIITVLLSTQACALDINQVLKSAQSSRSSSGGFSDQDATLGLREALSQGSSAAVSRLGIEDGFLKNDVVRIPLPDALKKAEKAMKYLGKQKDFDNLVVGMNRAAEQAVPMAKTLLVDSIRSMTVDDARQIISGGDNSVTQFFKSKTSEQLHTQFLPIVKQTTDKVGLAQQYNSLAGQASQFGLVKKQDSTIEGYVTTKALDGLYHMIGEEERAIRKNPMKYGSEILRKVFGRN
jgi:hypothetical protein